MRNERPRTAADMRVMAIRMREYAARTTVGLFRRKFEAVAADLEEAAIDLESRDQAKPPPRLMSQNETRHR